jgi:hypothetical protein
LNIQKHNNHGWCGQGCTFDIPGSNPVCSRDQVVSLKSAFHLVNIMPYSRPWLNSGDTKINNSNIKSVTCSLLPFWAEQLVSYNCSLHCKAFSFPGLWVLSASNIF